MSVMPDHGVQPPSVGLLLLPETSLASLFGLKEVFGAVGNVWEKLTGEQTDVAPIETRIVAAAPRGVQTSMGPLIIPDSGLTDVDVVITTDLTLDASASPRGRWAAEADWLRIQYERGAAVCSVCTGAIALAEAGLLAGRTATTHWGAARMLQACYPDVRVEASRVLALAGEDQRIITTGGVASWEDLAIYLICRFRGNDEGIRIAKIFLFGDRTEGQLPFSAMERPRSHDDAVIKGIQAWAAENYARHNPVQEMSVHTGLPARTLARRFRRATGFSPIDYVQTLRIEQAKRLLEGTSMPVDDIAVAIGYEDPTHFRRLFKKRTATTPARYRKRYSVLVTPLDAEAQGRLCAPPGALE